MKYVVVLIIVFASCDNVNKREFYYNSRNFDYCSDRFRENLNKCSDKILAGQMDSVRYYQGIYNAYYQMESKFLEDMKKTK